MFRSQKPNILKGFYRKTMKQVSSIAYLYQVPRVYKLAIVGLGGRANYLLIDLLNVIKELNSQAAPIAIKVIAGADSKAKESFAFFKHKLSKEKSTMLHPYKEIFKGVQFYGDSQSELKELFNNHTDLDMVWVTSKNDLHFDHIEAVTQYSACKIIYMEKPLFKSLDELKRFTPNPHQTIYVGLTLRYSSMTKIVTKTLQEFQSQLGDLKYLKSREHVRFAQALTCFMMSWRRDKALSGGLLLEKSIHDLDLALFFLQALGIDPQTIEIETSVAHNFYKKSKIKEIIQATEEDAKTPKPKLANRDLSPFQPLISFQKNKDGSINWPATIEAIFADFPDDEELDNSKFIPDSHLLKVTITEKSGKKIDFELDVQLGGTRRETERDLYFNFENGTVKVDIMASEMEVNLANGQRYKVNIDTQKSDHADGDHFIAHTLFDSPQSKNQHKAKFDDPIVQLATLIGLISEHQAFDKRSEKICIKKLNGSWEYSLSTNTEELKSHRREFKNN